MYKWILVVVEDHSRYKLISLLKHKSEAITKADEFIANLKSMASSKADSPVKIVGKANVNKCDNAGEFHSREFRKMLTDKGIHQTTCPPHVHQLNGIAERTICFMMEQVRVRSEPGRE